MIPTDRISYLLSLYATNTATDEEVEELFAWLREHREDEVLQLQLEKMAVATPPNEGYNPAYWESFIQQVLSTDTVPVRKINHRRWFRYAAAAVFIIGIGTAAVVSLTNHKKSGQTPANGSKQLSGDAIPGKEGAVLTLADGRQVVLDSMGNGVVATQGKTTVLINNRQLVYNAGTAEHEILYNTMTTPKGRQYQLVLPDGTVIWLNAASSITYPTAFVGKTRNVTITGEAYFEVAKDKTKPFHVKVNDMEVAVLGTHFNINAYADEVSIKTTLLEGSVSVKKGNDKAMLKPGQQAQLAVAPSSRGGGTSPDRQPATTAGITIINNTDLDQVMAWKNGSFQFKKMPLSEVMRQLSRWYDVDVVYEKGVPDINLGGEMKRDLNLSQVLKGLGKMGVNFRIEGKKLVVLP